MPITTGNTPKALMGAIVNRNAPAKSLLGAAAKQIQAPNPLSRMEQLKDGGGPVLRRPMMLAQGMQEAMHNDGGCAYHRGYGEAWCSKHHA